MMEPAHAKRHFDKSRALRTAEVRKQMSELYLLGFSLRRIGEEVGMSFNQVGKHLEAIRQEWVKETLINFDQVKAAQLAKLDKAESEYWAAWERSKGEQQHSFVERSEDAEGEKKKTSLKKINRDGDPRFLDGVLEVINTRCRILGLNSPTKVAVGGDPDAPPIKSEMTCKLKDCTTEELLALRQARNRLHGLGGGAPSEPSPN